LFFLVSLNTVFLPVWLNESISFSLQEIGLFLGCVGALKVFSNFFFTKNIKSIRAKRLVIIFVALTVFLVFSFISLIKDIPISVLAVLIFFLLLIFSPTISLVENININLNQQFYSSYGKLRISGSIAFLIAVIFFGALLDKYGVNNLPIFYIFFSIIFLFSAFLIPVKHKKEKILKSNVLKLLKDSSFLIVLISCSFILASHAMYYAFSSIYWKAHRLTLLQIGVLWSWGVIAEVLFFYFIDKVRIRNIIFQLILFVGLITSLRWVLTYFFNNFYILLLIQSLHAFSFGLSHYLIIYYIHSHISSNNKLIAQSLYHGLSSGIIMTVLTILAGNSFKYNIGGLGFLMMAFFSFLSVFLVSYRRLIISNEKK
jgi:PPP family 3-phenylpropionic acid transporter